jgi:hypothetical protein
LHFVRFILGPLIEQALATDEPALTTEQGWTLDFCDWRWLWGVHAVSLTWEPSNAQIDVVAAFEMMKL